MNTFGKMILAAGRTAYKHLPEILTGLGMVASVSATGLAVYETIQYDNETVSLEKDKKEEAKSIVRHFAPVAAVEVGSLVLTSFGAKTYRQRINTLTNGFSALAAAFLTYRGRVAAKYGEEEEMRLYYGIEEKTVEEKDENGKKVKVKKNVLTDGPIAGDPYTHIWDNRSDRFSILSGEAGLADNNMQLTSCEGYFNTILKSRRTMNHPGYVFLNEVLKYLDLPTTKAGQCVGWIFDEENPDGDNQIKIRSTVAEMPNAFDKSRTINGYILNFNCDGNILNRAWGDGKA